MSKSLVIGGSGLIGAHLAKALINHPSSTTITFNSHPVANATRLDIQQPDQVMQLLAETQPDTVYLPAALPNVEYCETNPLESFAINVKGVVNVVMAVNQIGAKLVYFSSDYIFDGQAGPYYETDIAHPINQYGYQKLLAEHYISLHSKRFLIIRTTVVYGWEQQKKNFIYRLLNALTSGNTIKVPVDQIGTPTPADELARIVIQLSSLVEQEIVNVTGPNLISRYNFAVKVAEVFNLPHNLITPVKTNDLKQFAPRPLKAGLRIDKLQAILQPKLSQISESLGRMRANPPLQIQGRE